MEYEWDEAKSERTWRERGLRFDGPVLVTIDDRLDYVERRWRAIGEVGGVVLACVYTERGEVRRIISLRRASRRERHEYHAAQTL